MKNRILTFLAGCLVLSSCASPGGDPASASDAPESPVTVDRISSPYLFSDMTEEAGITFTHFNSASAERLLPETMGSGVAVFDYDNDGWPDIYFVNGAPLKRQSDATPVQALWRNLGNGRFEDVTKSAGLDVGFFGMGAAVGDIENDGWLDLVVSGTDRVRVFRNQGDGRFREAAGELNLNCPGYGSSVAFLDYDRDGFLDVFVGRYVKWTPETDIPCSPDGVHRTYCTPEVYPAIENCLFRNMGGRKFLNATKRSGLSRYPGKALGVVVLDINDDGWPDIAVANDTVGNLLLVNQMDGTFSDLGEDSGMAYSESGAARGGMGIDAGDIDRDGLVDIVIGNFSQEMVAFFRGMDSGFFIDDAAQVGIGIPTLMTLAFGTLVEDFDNDGWLDILIVNGHIEPNISQTRQSQAYQQPPQFFHNLGEGKFSAVPEDMVVREKKLLVARGFASADFDGDGDLDFVLTQNGGAAHLLRNESHGNHWLRVKLEGTKSNRVGYGAKLRVVIGDTVMTRFLVSGRSYLSASEPILSVGLGDQGAVDRLEITWPSGEIQTVLAPAVDQVLKIQEPTP